MTMEKEILVETLKDATTRKVDLLDIIKEQANKVRDLTRNTKPTKAAKIFQEEEEQKLIFLENIIKKSVQIAYLGEEDIQDIIYQSDSMGQLMRYFDVEVIVRRKTTK